VKKCRRACPSVTVTWKVGVFVAVDVELQRLRVYSDGKVVKEYIVSTATNGVGFTVGSEKTPTGNFKINSLVGAGAPIGMDFEYLKATGKSSGPNDKAALQTRVITIQGLDANNKNSLARAIYIHGTNKPHELGRPASAGCVRLSNEDILDLFARVKVGVKLRIAARCAWP